AGLDLRAAQNVLEIKWQRDESQALDRERADRSGRGQREQRPAEQVDRQHRRRMIGLSADYTPAQHYRDSQLERHEFGPGVMRGAANPQHQKAETPCRQQRAEKIEGMSRSRGTRQRLQADQDRNQAEG